MHNMNLILIRSIKLEHHLQQRIYIYIYIYIFRDDRSQNNSGHKSQEE